MSILKSKLWSLLEKEYENVKSLHLKDLFNQDPQRAENFSLKLNNIYFDYSKNLITKDSLNLLLALVDESALKQKIAALFNGEIINTTENRPALHTALRDKTDNAIIVDNKNIKEDIKTVLEKMQSISDKIRSKKWLGYTNKPITNIINIGIGGSHLGPEMAYEALKFYSDPVLTIRFVSNIDSTDFVEKVKDLNPEQTLFIIASKTFTTQETMTNAQTAKRWLLETLKDEQAISSHFIALSTNILEATKFGINPENILEFWDWVGGRYSLSSAIGLSVMISIGFDSFDKMLQGFHHIDQHFSTAPPAQNIPIILALLEIWYNNFFNYQTLAILPYAQSLHKFPAYLQQLDMESNGKSVTINGEKINYQTGPIIWGEVGTNGQHAFYQLLHQGTKIVPADFIGFKNPLNPISDHHQKLLANFIAQTQALAFGTEDENLPSFKSFPGNRPSNTLLIDSLTPYSLGQLIAIYEHKTFVQGVIWDINSFDQFGVELGKSLAKNILNQLTTSIPLDNDSSTNNLIKQIKNLA